jgi:multidrug efflux pump subunit AcrB
VFDPILIHPTEWALDRITAGYARLLKVSLRHWGVVLVLSTVLIGVSAFMLYADVLGRELVPSEDQSRFVVHVLCPVGSSIQQVDELLMECENLLTDRFDVESVLTTVATEAGQLMNEADLFVQLVPQNQRRRRQHEIMREVRADLEQIRSLRVVIRDLSTEGFTAQRGAQVQDLDSDYRPGMEEVQIMPDRDKLALVGIPASRVADSLSLLVGGQRVAKYTDKGRRYDVRVRLLAPQRASSSSPSSSASPSPT